jgi:hypothetical protein
MMQWICHPQMVFEGYYTPLKLFPRDLGSYCRAEDDRNDFETGDQSNRVYFHSSKVS